MPGGMATWGVAGWPRLGSWVAAGWGPQGGTAGASPSRTQSVSAQRQSLIHCKPSTAKLPLNDTVASLVGLRSARDAMSKPKLISLPIRGALWGARAGAGGDVDRPSCSHRPAPLPPPAHSSTGSASPAPQAFATGGCSFPAIAGKAETIRMALAAAGVEFDFEVPDREVLKLDLDQYPFGQVPRWVPGGCGGCWELPVAAQARSNAAHHTMGSQQIKSGGAVIPYYAF